MKAATLGLAAIGMAIWPVAAWSCGGPAGKSVAISFDGQKYTIANVGRQQIHVTFGAWNTNFALQLAPGQSGSPTTPGTFPQPMSGYQSCYAVAVSAR
jgi:hypothetical protein